MRTWKTFGDIACIILACLGVFSICAFAYYSIFNDDITIGINNIGDQVGLDIIKNVQEETGMSSEEIAMLEDRWFMNVNYYDNSKNNGFELAELRFDYFTSYRLESVDYRSTGMQYVGSYQGDGTIKYDTDKGVSLGLPWYSESNNRYYVDDASAGQFVDADFSYYDTTNGINWDGGGLSTELKRDTQFIIKIDGRPFAIQLTGTEQVKVGDVRNLFGIGWVVGTKYQTIYYTYSQIFKDAIQAVKTNNVGYGNYYITLDLSKYFTIREYDAGTGKFKTDNVTDIIKNYSVLKFHYEANGAISSSQSMYGLINGNRKLIYGEGINYNTTYWQERMVYNLTENNLKLRYSEVYDGYFVSMPLAMQNMFNNMPRAKVNIVLNLTGKNIVGFDYNAFENFEIDTIQLVGGPQTFYLLDKCLYDSNLKVLKRSNGLILDFGTNAINNTYSEVII